MLQIYNLQIYIIYKYTTLRFRACGSDFFSYGSESELPMELPIAYP